MCQCFMEQILAGNFHVGCDILYSQSAGSLYYITVIVFVNLQLRADTTIV